MKKTIVDIKVDAVMVGKQWRYSVRINASRFKGLIEPKYGYKTEESAKLAGWNVIKQVVSK